MRLPRHTGDARRAMQVALQEAFLRALYTECFSPQGGAPPPCAASAASSDDTALPFIAGSRRATATTGVRSFRFGTFPSFSRTSFVASSRGLLV